MASIGIDLARHIHAGVLRVHSLRAGAESPETHVARIRSLLREALAKTAGISVVSTSLLGNSLRHGPLEPGPRAGADQRRRDARRRLLGGEVVTGTLRWEKENDARRTRAAAQAYLYPDPGPTS